MKFIKRFDEIRAGDVALVGGKNASLGEMVVALSKQGITVPNGFAVTADAYWYYLESNKLLVPMRQAMAKLVNVQDLAMLRLVGAQVRALIGQGTVPKDLAAEIVTSYHALSKMYGQSACDVAVRSSATAEDLPTASFAGQQETYLNVHGDDAVVGNYKKCLASLFTDRAIAYRVDQGFDHFKVALSVGVQKMIRSDLACSGVAFSLDTETGFKDVVMIDASWGLGESIVQGLVVPDEFLVHKPTFGKGFASIIKKRLGSKQTKMVYTESVDSPVKTVPTSQDEQKKYTLTDAEILALARMVVTIEWHYSQIKGAWCPMDIEWAKDGKDNKLYIIQARPETVYGSRDYANVLTIYKLKTHDAREIITGQSIGQCIVSGTARVINSAAEIDQVQRGDIVITQMTDPDWVPIMKRAAGIVTDRGGRTCHAAIVSRELKIPAIVGTGNATATIKTGQKITLDCSQGKTGYVYEGIIPFVKTTIELKTLPQAPVELMVNIADPESAFTLGLLPVQGVGLARLEFMINTLIGIHPMALIYPERVLDAGVRKKIDALTVAYEDKKQFFIDTLSQGIGMIAAAFYPRPVIVRLSDFKSNEYRNLLGGSYFEPEEANPMLGFRGACRYYHPEYRSAFALECAALKKVRETMGLTNVKILVPFVRTLDEAGNVLGEIGHNGLYRGVNGLEILMMCEIPSNVILVDKFSKLFDGFSIGSNDLMQLTLGIDRDSALVSQLGNERDLAVVMMMKLAIDGAKRNKKYCGICGQAPSDFPEIAQMLIDRGISSISLNADAILPFLQRYTKK